MTLREFKTLLRHNDGKAFQLRLPGGDEVPASFHITEVGRVTKTFLDCGGELRQTDTCQIQAWVGDDEDHRLAASKLLAIFRKAAFLLPDEGVPLEIEYQDEVISQYPIANAEITKDAVILNLTTKQTDCLAKEACGLPADRGRSRAELSCCGTGCC